MDTNGLQPVPLTTLRSHPLIPNLTEIRIQKDKTREQRARTPHNISGIKLITFSPVITNTGCQRNQIPYSGTLCTVHTVTWVAVHCYNPHCSMDCYTLPQPTLLHGLLYTATTHTVKWAAADCHSQHCYMDCCTLPQPPHCYMDCCTLPQSTLLHRLLYTATGNTVT